MPCYPLRSSRGFRPDPFLQIAPELQLRPDGELGRRLPRVIFCRTQTECVLVNALLIKLIYYTHAFHGG